MKTNKNEEINLESIEFTNDNSKFAFGKLIVLIFIGLFDEVFLKNFHTIFTNLWFFCISLVLLLLLLFGCFLAVFRENPKFKRIMYTFKKLKNLYNYIIMLLFILVLEYSLGLEIIWKNSINIPRLSHLTGILGVIFILIHSFQLNEFKNEQISKLNKKIQILQNKLKDGK